MTTLIELEHRIASLEEKVQGILETRRWFFRAFALVAMTAVGSLIPSLITHI